MRLKNASIGSKGLTGLLLELLLKSRRTEVLLKAEATRRPGEHSR
jgi:hypothetical protein